MKEEKGRGREDMARKSFETFDGKLLIRRSSHCSLNLLFLIILRFPCLLDHYVEKSLPCRGCKGWLNQESPELYIYIYIHFIPG